MASPNHSLDSLSSPSPSPSPPPSNKQLISASTSTNVRVSTATAPPLDTDSELSELTDDDQDTPAAGDKRVPSTSAPSSFKAGQGHLEGGDDDTLPASLQSSSSTSLSQPGKHQRSLSARRGGGTRKKRSSIVPAPMWGWAESKAPSGTAPAEEEEEEDTAGPPREEEEEEEEEEVEVEEEDGDDDAFHHGEDSAGGQYATQAGRTQKAPSRSTQASYGVIQRARPRSATARSPNKFSTFQSRRGTLQDQHPRQRSEDRENEDDEDDYDNGDKHGKSSRLPASPSKRATHRDDEDESDHLAVNGNGDDDESGSGSEYASTKKKRLNKGRVSSKKRKGNGAADDNSGSEHHASKKKRNGARAYNQKGLPNPQELASNVSDDNNSTETEDDAPELSKRASPTATVKGTANPNTKSNMSNANVSSTNTATTALSALAALADAAETIPSPIHDGASVNKSVSSTTFISGAPIASGKPSAPVGVGPTEKADISTNASSRSHSPEDEPGQSEDDAKPPRGRARGGKPVARGRKPKSRVKVAGNVTTNNDHENVTQKVNGAFSTSNVVDSANVTATANSGLSSLHSPTNKKGPPPPLDLKINTRFDDPMGVGTVAESGEDRMAVDSVEEEVPDQSVGDRDVSMEADEHEEEEEEEEEEEDGEDERDDQSVREEEEEPEHAEGENVEADHDADEDGGEGDDNEGDDEHDQENENENDIDHDAGDAEQENEGDNDEEPSPVDADVDAEDHESDLQPAHRAEALDVLATIELKFALLRERVYVEKMEGLAWEESMVQSASHPEMLHLQKELSQRRDKRLELASRKRSYEVANATTRRKADEAGVWSWWKAARDELQIEMIAEASRKRRRLERERRTFERPQPVRRIPLPPHVDIHNLPPLPNLRKIVKSYPFGHRKPTKSGKHHSHSDYPKNLAYPEISTLSASDIAQDLEFLFQNRRLPTTFDMQQQPLQTHHLQPSNYPSQFPHRNGSTLGSNIQGAAGIPVNRPPSMGVGMANGSLTMQPPPSSIGHPHSHSGPMLHQGQHVMGYDQYTDGGSQYGPGGPPPSSSGRMRDHPSNYQSGGPQPTREPLNPYPNFPGRQQSSHPHGPTMSGNSSGVQTQPSHGYPGDHEMSTIGPAVSSVPGVGQQLLPNHPYFGQGNMTSSNAGNGHSHPQSHSGTPLHVSNSHVKGMNSRRSISPVHVVSNGSSAPGGVSKSNGNWMGPVMGMAAFNMTNGGKGPDWDTRPMHEEEEREKIWREKERDRKRDEREKEHMERERIRHRDRELQELDRERQREHQHAQQYRQGPPSSTHGNLPPIHSSGASGPSAQGSGVVPHHHVPHHHHRTHHHHVVHHHHGQGPQHASSSLPPSNSGGAPIVHSPRSTREYDNSRPPSLHQNSSSSHPLPTEVITLSSGKTSQIPLGHRERDGASHWSTKNSDDHHHPSSLDYRDREREVRDRDRDTRKVHNHRHSSGPPMMPLDDRSDRPMAMPFVMASSQTMQQTNAALSSASHANGSGGVNSTASPRVGPSWNTPASTDDASYRVSSSSAPPSGYSGLHEPHSRSPVQSHRYPSSSSHVPSMGRMPNNSTSSNLHRIGSPPLPPSNRARAPPSPSYSKSISNSQRSPLTSPKNRPLSPPPNTGGKQLLSGPLPGPGYSSSPRLSGPGRIATPLNQPPSGSLSSIQSDVIIKNGVSSSYNVGSRTASPLMSSLHVPPGPNSSRSSVNGGRGGSGGPQNIGDRDRDRIDRDRERHVVSSPRMGSSSVPYAPPSSKLSA